MGNTISGTYALNHHTPVFHWHSDATHGKRVAQLVGLIWSPHRTSSVVLGTHSTPLRGCCERHTNNTDCHAFRYLKCLVSYLFIWDILLVSSNLPIWYGCPVMLVLLSTQEMILHQDQLLAYQIVSHKCIRLIKNSKWTCLIGLSVEVRWGHFSKRQLAESGGQARWFVDAYHGIHIE